MTTTQETPIPTKLIAIAAGTGTIGQSIASALLEQPEYKPIMLSRARKDHPEGTKTFTKPSLLDTERGVETRFVEYTSLPS